MFIYSQINNWKNKAQWVVIMLRGSSYICTSIFMETYIRLTVQIRFLHFERLYMLIKIHQVLFIRSILYYYVASFMNTFYLHYFHFQTLIFGQVPFLSTPLISVLNFNSNSLSILNSFIWPFVPFIYSKKFTKHSETSNLLISWKM